ncbi:glycosyltransferase family 87 protein [Novosphingobium sp. 9U]|uniref:glycosyltransferase family 87 protein n=1 Tax=Novosphingobium sp. 9U TaxID=2653158 RepID=UPI0012F38E9D|nr:glycosyltransferase family 87 protein [Novosphingobium sp. 9U]VWX51532.1 conserved membrane hypothetical protein [Novosphingobium sp. 9U]
MGLDLRRADWLTATRAKAYLWILALLNLGTLGALMASARNGVDRNGFLLGTDFLSFWTVGRMLQGHANPYDQAAHIAAQQAYFTQADAFTAFFYPPGFLPFCYPLGWLSYFPALIAWLLLTGAAFAFSLRRWLKAFPIGAPWWLLLAAFPATVIEITHGQTAFLSSALLTLGMLVAGTRPYLAGILFGLATLKPQFGVLLPVVLLLTGQWRVGVSAVLTAAALGVFSAAVFGPHVWADWFMLTQAAQAAMDAGTVGYAKMVSPFAALMLLGIPQGPAYIVHAAIAIAVAAMLATVSWRRRYTPELGALALAGAVLASPFVLDYDMLLLMPAMIVVGSQGIAGGFRAWERLALLLAFAAPAFARPLGMNLHLPIMPEIAFFLFWVLWRRARAAPLESSTHA